MNDVIQTTDLQMASVRDVLKKKEGIFLISLVVVLVPLRCVGEHVLRAPVHC